MAVDKPFFISQNQGFAPIDDTDDLLHPDKNSLVEHESLSETQYFGFSIPEQRIHALTYLWHRPNLHLVTGGVWAWHGIKQSAVHSELFDIRTFMKDTSLANDLHDYRLENGYGVKILEPLKRFHMTYDDASRNSSIDLIYEAVSPAVMYADGNHFEQAMEVKGEVVLRGKRYKVDCFNVRDRSWGKPRPEDNMTLPPSSWVTGVFHKEFSFNCAIFDQASNNPELSGPFAMPEERTLNAGWLYRDGQVGRIVQAQKRVARAPGTLLPISVELEVTDEFDRTVKMHGNLIASCPWQTWANVNMTVSLMRWECEGLVAYGDCQEPMWNDYYNFMATQ